MLPAWLLANQHCIKPIWVTNLYSVQEHCPTAGHSQLHLWDLACIYFNFTGLVLGAVILYFSNLTLTSFIQGEGSLTEILPPSDGCGHDGEQVGSLHGFCSRKKAGHGWLLYFFIWTLKLYFHFWHSLYHIDKIIHDGPKEGPNDYRKPETPTFYFFAIQWSVDQRTQH